MNTEEKIFHTVFGPIASEKTVQVREDNIYTFKVAVGSNKLEIKKAVEVLFEVKVAGVKTVNVKGKTKNFGRRKGKRSDWKKAYVKLAEGETLELATEG